MSEDADGRRSFEELRVGESFSFGPYEMTEDRVVEFARSFDPQPMHLDPEAGRASPLGGLAASGWHTAAVAMRLFHDAWLKRARSAGSPGIARNAWPRALMANETVRGEGKIVAKRPLRSRPGLGLAEIEIAMRGSAGGAEVLQARWSVLFERSEADPPPENGAVGERATADDAPPATRSEASLPTLSALYLDGSEPGQSYFLGETSASEAEIVAFARAFDPQPFHVDARAAEAGPFRGLCASGWHSCALWMRTNVLARQAILADLTEAERRSLEHSAAVGLGFESLSWRRPVRPDRRLLAFMTMLEARESRSRPGWGIARWRSELTDADGNLVLRFRPSLLMRTSRPEGRPES